MYKGNCKLQTAKKDTLIEKNQEKGGQERLWRLWIIKINDKLVKHVPIEEG